MVFLRRGQAFSAGSNGNYGGKMEIISDCRVNSVLKKQAGESHKAETICDLQTQKHCIISLDVSEQ